MGKNTGRIKDGKITLNYKNNLLTTLYISIKITYLKSAVVLLVCCFFFGSILLSFKEETGGARTQRNRNFPVSRACIFPHTKPYNYANGQHENATVAWATCGFGC